MNPLIVEAVLWGVFWLVVRSIGAFVLIWAGFILGGLLAAATKTAYGILTIVVALLAAAAWEIFSVIQIVLEIIRVVQLVLAGA